MLVLVDIVLTTGWIRMVFVLVDVVMSGFWNILIVLIVVDVSLTGSWDIAIVFVVVDVFSWGVAFLSVSTLHETKSAVFVLVFGVEWGTETQSKWIESAGAFAS